MDVHGRKDPIRSPTRADFDTALILFMVEQFDLLADQADRPLEDFAV